MNFKFMEVQYYTLDHNLILLYQMLYKILAHKNAWKPLLTNIV